MKRSITVDEFWQLVENPADRVSYDGVWYSACTTTRIYCRPLCPAVGHVKPQNVTVFPSAAAAEAAGYRPCLTCCPEDAPAFEGTQSIEEDFGVTPEQFAATQRRLAAKKMMREGMPTLEKVALTCGYANEQELVDDFATAYKLDARKLASQRPRKPRLAHFS